MSREDKTDFKRPDLKRYHPGQRRSRSTKVPDFVKNPAKWTMYDLSDDGTENLSEDGLSDDQVNKRAAFQFLEKMKKLKADRDPENSESDVSDSKSRHGESSSHSSSASHKLIFHKPEQLTTAEGGSPGEQPRLKSTGCSSSAVVRMPEYVVGGKDSSRRKRPKLKVVGRGGETESAVSEEGNLKTDEKSTKRRKTSAAAAICLSHLEEEIED